MVLGSGDDTDLVFRAKFTGTGPDNDPWLAGKAAVARRYSAPSLLVRRRHEEAGTPFETVDDPTIDHALLKAHGGSIPLFVQGILAGTITTSGEPDVVDHETAADALAAYQASTRR
ncbi:heme-binding protein [Herbiconiux sp. P15]|uniref:heme-binding protein n=1 Tax=Herbiconiux liukaitaii TaxID=3342799 RepID=UPI0035B91097